MSFCGLNKKKCPALLPPSAMPSALDALYEYYLNKVRPVEEITSFNKITTPGFTKSELTGKPTILFLGPYSTGKTTMINYIINNVYKGSKIGPEPTTENFTVLTYGDEEKVIDSNTIICMQDYQFRQVESFGQQFLNKFQQVEVPSEILKSVNIIDTPGIYENTDEEGTGVGYQYNKVLRYFCQRVEMIVVLFDVNRLGSCVPKIMKLLEPFKEKIKVILNKSDTISPDSLLKVRENLLWQLAKVINTYDIVNLYYGSYWDYDYDETFMTTIIKKDQKEFEKDINEFAKHFKNTRIGQIQKRARKIRFYYHLHSLFLKKHFRIKQKKDWAKTITAAEFKNIAKVLVDTQITTECNVPPVEEWTSGVKKLNDLKSWKTVDKILDSQLEEFINKDLNSIILCANQEKSPEWNLMLNRPRIRKHQYDSLEKKNIVEHKNKPPEVDLKNKNISKEVTPPLPPLNNNVGILNDGAAKIKLSTDVIPIPKNTLPDKTSTTSTKSRSKKSKMKNEFKSPMDTQLDTPNKTTGTSKKNISSVATQPL
uniref:Dynamin_N domain-containing protein n=1 Tax=Strongyloides venezuelensis TaxID=75913 RepID=A0A0K0F5M2_STRVS